jgi:fatty acid desaturase
MRAETDIVFTEAGLRRRFASAFRPRPWIYWSDLLASVSIGWTAFAYSAQCRLSSPAYSVATVLATVALLRAALFIHELAHRKPGTLPGFELMWNLLVGFPFLLPSLMYVGSHGDHHRQALFGTAGDPEYVPMATWSRWRIVAFVLTTAIVPLLLIARWGILAPVSFFIPRLRRLIRTRASTLVINPAYCRPAPHGRWARWWATQEAMVASVFWIGMGCLLAGWIAPRWLGQWYLVGAAILLVNQVRTLAAHRYSNDGRPLGAIGQLLDSINLQGRPLPTVLAAPLGLRYHALHHFLPTVPYHSLGALHRRLTAELPAESTYHRTGCPGIIAAVCALWRHTPQNAPDPVFSENRVVKEV